MISARDIRVPPVVLHITHSSDAVPDDVRRQFLLDEEQLRRELLCMTDWYTDELFTLPPSEAATVRFPVSRLVLDPERFLDPVEETMERVGMGVVYTKTSHGAPLRDEAVAEREHDALLARFYPRTTRRSGGRPPRPWPPTAAASSSTVTASRAGHCPTSWPPPPTRTG